MSSEQFSDPSVSSTDQSTNITVCTNQNIVKLLGFQEKFIAAVHSQIYIHPTITSDIIVQFQINHVTDLNEQWGNMITELTEALITKKMPYENTLRSYFHKLLNMDYLPLLRINRYQLTHLSLYGFDIYVSPLSAILEIINRIDGFKYSIENYMKHSENKEIAVQNGQFYFKPHNAWDNLSLGWVQYIYRSALWKISLNIYILKEYLKIGAKSLVKKDKQIIFTGCNNIFNAMVPVLKQKKQIWLLSQFAELANQLYMFHPSYSYSLFFSLLLPLRNQYEPIFKNCQIISEKCCNTYILTPLLFAILRNYQSFLHFVQQANDECWARYLNGLAFGLLVNFKARILEYEEVLSLFKAIVLKLGLMSKLQIHMHLRGQLEKQWGEARQFFISALKTGYNFGDLQTWHPVNQEQIQSQILISSRDSLLMHSQLPKELTTYIAQQNYSQFIEKELYQITETKVTIDQFCNFFNEKLASKIQNKNWQKAVYSIIRISNLVILSKIDSNPNVVSYMFALLSKIQTSQHQLSNLMQKRLKQIVRYFLSKALEIIFQNQSQSLKQSLKNSALKFIYQEQDCFPWFQLIIYNGTPKQSLLHIFEFIEANQTNKVKIQNQQKLAQWLAVNILVLYRDQKEQNYPISLKTFKKEYNVPKCIINLNNKMHNCFVFLIKRAIFQKSELALQTLLNICQMQNCYAIPLLSFPINFSYSTEEQEKDNMKRSMIIQNSSSNTMSTINKSKLECFSMWFIKNLQLHKYLKQLVFYCVENNGKGNNISEYAEEISNMTIYQQVVNEINTKLMSLNSLEDKQVYVEIIDLIVLLNDLFQIRKNQSKNQEINNTFYRKLMKLFLRVFDGVQSRIVVSRQKRQKGPADGRLAKSNRQTINKLVQSLLGTYFQILNRSFNQIKEGDVKLWIIYMKKICSISLIPPVEGIQKKMYAYSKDYGLPSIKKDSSFLIQNSIDYLKQTPNLSHSHKISPKQSFQAIKNTFQQLPSNKNPLLNQQSQVDFSKIINLIPSDEQIRNLKIEELTQKQLTKQFLLPSLSADTIAQFLDYIYNDEQFNKKKQVQSIRKTLIIILSLSPSNHHKLIEECINSYQKQSGEKTLEILNYMGLTKQIVNFDGKNLRRILEILAESQSKQLSMSEQLDQNCKKVISDGFLVSSIVNSSGYDKITANNQFIISLLGQKSLHFLLVYNQSNWRHLIDWLCNNINITLNSSNSSYSRTMPIKSSISSIILQYLEYIRITKANNEDYEKKIQYYQNLISAYAQMLTLKCRYLDNLQSQCQQRQNSSISHEGDSIQSRISQFSSFDKNSSMSEVNRRTRNTLIVQTLISEEQIRLYHTNQLANIKLFTEAAMMRQVLKRISSFKVGIRNIYPNQTSDQELKEKYKNVLTSYEKCLENIETINSCSNRISKGSIVLPDFIRSYLLCSDESYNKNKIQIGANLQDYYTELSLPYQDKSYNMQYSQPIPIVQLIETHCLDLSQCSAFPQNAKIKAEGLSQASMNNLNKKYTQIKEILLKEKILIESSNILDILSPEEEQDEQLQLNHKNLLGYCGLLNAFLIHNTAQLSPLLQQLVSRQTLSYDLLKTYHKENYHYIKSILIDDEEGLEKSQITFTLKDKELVPGGKQIKVNANNRQIYCNQVAKRSLGLLTLKKLQQFTRGYVSFL